MTPWPLYPVLYEINTWAWLHDLSRAQGQPVTLANVPQAELERLASYGFDALWLMGVWQRSPAARQVARDHRGLQEEYHKALADFSPEDVVGSPYAVQDYTVDSALGGDDDLVTLRSRLHDLGLHLMLDFVPNHMAVDHAWLATAPSRLVQGGADRLARESGNYFQIEAGGQWRVFAHGRDPYFDGWTDTVQIDYRPAETRRVMTDFLLHIAERCDGVRCDMAMLVTHDVFLNTWGGQFEPPKAEFWPAALTDLKARYPGFLTMAEVYWDMEWELQQQGFDYTYDKRLYDRLREGDAMATRLHLNADMDFQSHLVRFTENHDEERAAAVFGVERSKAMALLALTLPGLRLLHEGQLTGRRMKLPVQLGRRQAEEPVRGLEAFYRRLLAVLKQPVFHDGQWQLLAPLPAWQGNASHRNVVAHQWMLDDHCRVIAVNLSARPAQFFVPLTMPELAGRDWQLRDLLSDESYRRSGDEMLGRGLYVDLAGYGFHLLAVQRPQGT